MPQANAPTYDLNTERKVEVDAIAFAAYQKKFAPSTQISRGHSSPQGHCIDELAVDTAIATESRKARPVSRNAQVVVLVAAWKGKARNGLRWSPGENGIGAVGFHEIASPEPATT